MIVEAMNHKSFLMVDSLVKFCVHQDDSIRIASSTCMPSRVSNFIASCRIHILSPSIFTPLIFDFLFSCAKVGEGGRE